MNGNPRDPPNEPEAAPEAGGELGSLPEPALDPQEPPRPLRAGWWRDPFRITPNEQRYHDGAQWTRFTSRQVEGVWSGIVERSPSYYRGRINGEERPEARFLPEPKSRPLDPPDPPSVGWWVDPFRSYGHEVQRYYDGRAWTLYTSEKTPRGWQDIVETPAEPPPPDLAPGGFWKWVRRDPMSAGGVLFLIGCVVLIASNAFDRHGATYRWFTRVGLLGFVVGITTLAVTITRSFLRHEV